MEARQAIAQDRLTPSHSRDAVLNDRALDGPSEKRPTIAFFDQALSAGFPSPAADHLAVGLDLTALLVRHPAATFMLRVSGDSMTGAGIHDGDLAIVDRSLEARPGHVVVAVLDGEFVLTRLRLRGGRLFLDAENPKFRSCVVPGENGFEIWGVVTATIHPLSAASDQPSAGKGLKADG
ncbi:MAG: translesion error-prone DNA polymerase V autoproteolytic subunit [Rhodospirillales bacterium]|nr:MAG: translesion error-prone DNA polymerase V autoproteolytic subunit [Rhodospirillales bacterium]